MLINPIGAVPLSHYYTKTFAVTNTGTLPVDIKVNASDTISGDLLSIVSFTTTLSAEGKAIETITPNKKWVVYNIYPGETINIKIRLNILLAVALGNNYVFNINYTIKAKQNNDLLGSDNSTYCYLSNTIVLVNTIIIG